MSRLKKKRKNAKAEAAAETVLREALEATALLEKELADAKAKELADAKAKELADAKTPAKKTVKKVKE